MAKLHGIPVSIVSDRDPIFYRSFLAGTFKLKATQLCMSTAYHPDYDGPTEVINRVLETYLCCFSVEQPNVWTDFIHWAENVHKTIFQASAGTNPFR